ncbi:MAG: tetratricopeptide repeat protein, partial [Planctomycetota bacterium]
ALDAAHRHGIVHRDLKPENIMLVQGRDGLKVKVLDFGLSKLVDTRMEASLATVPGRVIGTPFYMAPEQSSGEEADARTDLYAMGVIFYELIAGQRPFTGRNLTELLYAQATQDVPPIRELPAVEGLPEWVDAFVERALERDRGDRYQSAGAMAHDLREETVDGERRTDRPRPVAPAPRAAPSAKVDAGRPSWVLPVGIGAAALAVVASVFALRGNDGGSGGARSGDVVRVRERDPLERSEAERAYLDLIDSARTQIASGSPEAAEGSVNAFMRFGQVDAEAFVVRASLQAARGDLDLAAADLREARTRDPRYAEAFALSGWIELERDEIEKAGEFFESAIELDADDANALAGKAAVLSAAGGDDADVRGLLDRAVASDPRNWRAQFGLAELALRTGDSRAAIDGFIETKRLRGSSPEVLVGLAGAYLAGGRPQDAIQQYEEALDLAPRDPEITRALAAVQLDQEQFRDVVDLLDSLVGRGGSSAVDSALLGLAYHGLEDVPNAVASLQVAVDAGIDDARPRVLLASLLVETDKPERALLVLDDVLEREDAPAEAYLYRGAALLRLERYEEAEETLRAAVEIDRGCTAAWLMLGVLGMDYLEDGSRAADDLRAYLDSGGQDPRVEGWLRQLTSR